MFFQLLQFRNNSARFLGTVFLNQLSNGTLNEDLRDQFGFNIRFGGVFPQLVKPLPDQFRMFGVRVRDPRYMFFVRHVMSVFFLLPEPSRPANEDVGYGS